MPSGAFTPTVGFEPDDAGFMPTDPSPVAPRPLPDPTGEPDPTGPSGEVVPTPGAAMGGSGSGLIPADPSPVEPRGIPTGPSVEPDPVVPSGEVRPIPGVELVPTFCAKAELQPKSAANVATTNARLT